MKHYQGLKCPECGHEWNGHAVEGVAYEQCPNCSILSPEGINAVPGEIYSGSRVVPGCDRHAAPLPCQFC